MSYPSHDMDDCLILHLFMLDTIAGGTFMSKQVNVARRLLDDMQINHGSWHVEV
jgi:hypothetical protein